MSATESTVHPWRTLAREAQEMGLSQPADIAEWILDHAEEPFGMLSRHDQAQILTNWVRHRVILSSRGDAIRGRWSHEENGSGSREAVFRLVSSGKPAWSSSWMVGGRSVETAALTRANIEMLIAQFRQREQEMKARGLWLCELLALMRRHNVDVAGDLRKKGEELPDIEVREAE